MCSHRVLYGLLGILVACCFWSAPFRAGAYWCGPGRRRWSRRLWRPSRCSPTGPKPSGNAATFLAQVLPLLVWLARVRQLMRHGSVTAAPLHGPKLAKAAPCSRRARRRRRHYGGAFVRASLFWPRWRPPKKKPPPCSSAESRPGLMRRGSCLAPPPSHVGAARQASTRTLSHAVFVPRPLPRPASARCIAPHAGFGLCGSIAPEQAARRPRRRLRRAPETVVSARRVRRYEHLATRPTARELDPAEIHHGHHSDTAPSAWLPLMPLCVSRGCISNLLSRSASSRLLFPGRERFGGTSISAVRAFGRWSSRSRPRSSWSCVATAGRLPPLRPAVDAGSERVSAAALSVERLVGFARRGGRGLAAFARARLGSGIEGGPARSLAVPPMCWRRLT